MADQALHWQIFKSIIAAFLGYVLPGKTIKLKVNKQKAPLFKISFIFNVVYSRYSHFLKMHLMFYKLVIALIILALNVILTYMIQVNSTVKPEKSDLGIFMTDDY